jgi:hypothetical protein
LNFKKGFYETFLKLTQSSDSSAGRNGLLGSGKEMPGGLYPPPRSLTYSKNQHLRLVHIIDKVPRDRVGRLLNSDLCTTGVAEPHGSPRHLPDIAPHFSSHFGLAMIPIALLCRHRLIRCTEPSAYFAFVYNLSGSTLWFSAPPPKYSISLPISL